jgi:hypothetical protein
MIRLLADENFNDEILRGVRRRVPNADITRVQDTEMAAKPDPVILEWAVQHSFILLSHDVNTKRGYFYDRVRAELPVPALFLVHGTAPIGPVIETLELILLASDEAEWQGKIQFLPF